MLSPQALLKGLISRMLPQPGISGPESEGAVRMTPYRELFVNPTFVGKQALADEGAYFTSINGGAARGTAITFGLPNATEPVTNACALLAINNVDPGLSSGGTGKNVYVDVIEILTREATAPTGTVQVNWAAAVDFANRTPTANFNGPTIPLNVNLASPIASISRVYNCNAASGLTLAAAGPAQRVVDAGYFKFAATVTGDTYEVRFGNADAPAQQQIGTAMKYVSGAAPFVIPPQAWGIFYLAMSVAAANNVTYEYRLGLIEK